MLSAARIESALSLVQIMDHYVSQLVAAGWSIDSRALGISTVSVTRLTTKSSTSGESVTAILVVTPLKGTSDFDLMLRLVRDARGPRDRPGTSTIIGVLTPLMAPGSR